MDLWYRFGGRRSCPSASGQRCLVQLSAQPLGSAAVAACKAAVFDLGGVLIHWDPRLLYRKMLPSDAAVEQFLSTVCTSEWNAQQDAGRPLDDGVAEFVRGQLERLGLL